ncbi:hypothetical protein VKT23_007793 [Stygiomarasmius scandens]|uniref:Uncharacterized protein n=1 Tax=Marasmiellus scandens TaxID=2682957 RepID=A0ABR1JMN6_9AGAR
MRLSADWKLDEKLKEEKLKSNQQNSSGDGSPHTTVKVAWLAHFAAMGSVRGATDVLRPPPRKGSALGRLHWEDNPKPEDKDDQPSVSRGTSLVVETAEVNNKKAALADVEMSMSAPFADEATTKMKMPSKISGHPSSN